VNALNPNWLANPGVWSYGIAALVFGGFAVQLIVRWQQGTRTAFLLALAALSAVWAAASAIFAAAPSQGLWQFAHSVDAVRLGAALGFMLAFLGQRRRASGARRPSQLVATGAFAALAIAASLIVGVPPPGIPELGRPTHLLGFGIVLAIAILALALDEQMYRRTPSQFKWHVRPLALAFGGLVGYDLILYSDAALFRVLDENLWAARGIAQAMTVPLFALAVSRSRDWSFEVTVSRNVMASSTTLLVTSAYLLVVAAVGYYVRFFGGTWGRALESAMIFAALLLLAMIVVSETFRAKLRVFVAKNFFAYRYDYREEWLKFTRTLAANPGARPLYESCIQALADLVESQGGGLWLRQEGAYTQVARSVLPASDKPEPADSPFIQFMQRTGWVIDLADARSDPARYSGLELPPWLDAMGTAWLIVPLAAGDELVGFVVLAQPRVQIDLNWEILDLLKTAGRQAASYLAYVLATEALLEARKFESFNRMSAFVVHDLKNLIAQLQLMLRNAERHRDNPEFQRDMLLTVENVVGRMNQLMMQLRAGHTPIEPPRPVDLASIVRRVQQTRAAGHGGLEVEAPAGVMVLGHEDLLERVIGHLVQNAFDASGDNPRVAVRVAREGDDAVIEVTDQGRGMEPEFVRDRLFKPFQTTKAGGMGIGAYESQQYVNEIGGQIVVASVPDAGTSVRVLLRPVAPPTAAGAKL
jgi:putative PEP-CTERM system histidine kinase